MSINNEILQNLKLQEKPTSFKYDASNHITNNISNYALTYILIIFSILHDSITLQIAAMLISPFPKDLKAIVFNIINNNDPIYYISSLFLIILLYFIISLIIGFIKCKIYKITPNNNITQDFSYEKNFTNNKWILYFLTSCLISFSLCFYSSNFNNSSELVGIGIAITLLPALVVFGLSCGKDLCNIKDFNFNELSTNQITFNDISTGSGLIFIINLTTLILSLYLFHYYYKLTNNTKNIKKLFYNDKSLEDILNFIKNYNKP